MQTKMVDTHLGHNGQSAASHVVMASKCAIVSATIQLSWVQERIVPRMDRRRSLLDAQWGNVRQRD